MGKYNFVIYQVKVEIPYCFAQWELARKHGGWSFRPYRSVWSGIGEAPDEIDLLNHLWDVFNTNHPKGYRARSMSVSDIVGIYDANNADDSMRYYYCDTFGWEEVTEYVCMEGEQHEALQEI